ncbi:MAG: molybdenum ABC transporter ATP-binding protein [Acidobacteria bacterium]|nr:MAG: molybdenum ABC transporter ATP-binding protein [Acidobacteriota bacterium]
MSVEAERSSPVEVEAVSCLSFRCQHRYPSSFVLDAEFDTEEGVTALFGPSGSGKSTVLALIAGILRPQMGLIRLGDRVLLDTARGIDVPPEQRQVALVFQDHLLFPHLSVEGNLRFGLKRRPARFIDLKRVVEVLELRGLLRRSPQTLSGGERQRVALGRALLRGPELLLMDEPLAALDASLKSRILDYLGQSFAEWRIPTVFVSHDVSDTRRIATHIVALDFGKIVR